MTNALTLIRQWSDLPAPTLDDLVGTWKAEFVPPLRHIAPVGLGLIGLPRWYGKRFIRDEEGLAGVNLVTATDCGFEERLPMRVALGTSVKDGRLAGVITYADDAPRPWRWVRDEVRVVSRSRLAGATFVDGLPSWTGQTFILNGDG